MVVELDALEPSVLSQLVEDEIDKVLDTEKWNETLELESEGRQWLESASENWDRIVSFMQEE